MGPNLDPDLGQLIRRALQNQMLDLHTCMVGTVKSYDATQHTADVQLAAKRPILNSDDELVFEDWPLLPDVPVVALGTLRSHLRMPLEVGDAVLIVFAELSTAEMLGGQDLVEPGDTTSKGLSHGFAIPFVRPGSATGGELVAQATKVDDNFQLFVDMFSAWTPVAQDGGAALKAQFSATVQGNVTTTGAAEVLVK